MQAIPSLVVVVDREGDDRRQRRRRDAGRGQRRVPERARLARQRSSSAEACSTSSTPPTRISRSMAIAVGRERLSRAPSASRAGCAPTARSIVIAWTATPVADVTGRTAVARAPLRHRRDRAQAAGGGDPRLARAHHRGRGRARGACSSGTSTTAPSSVSSRSRSRSGSPSRARLPTRPDAATIIVGAREELAAALEELRELARGIHPAVLTDRGLAAAVEALVLRTPLPGRGRRCLTSACPRRSRRPPTTSSPRRSRTSSKYAAATRVDVVASRRRTDWVTVDGRRRRRRRRRPDARHRPARAPRPRRGARRDAARRQPARTAERGSSAEIPLERPSRPRPQAALVDSPR